MSAIKHKLRATIPHGPTDEGAEIECEITFTYLKGAPEQGPSYASGGQPADPDEIEFIDAAPLCNGKPAPFEGSEAGLLRAWLNDLAEAWLDTNEGQNAAFETVADDDESAREYAAELRAEDRT